MLLEELRETAAAAGQPAVAIADDSLFRINCMLGELDTAADALARGTIYRKRMGTVPSRYERTQLAPSVRVIREKLDPRDLAAAFRRARNQIKVSGRVYNSRSRFSNSAVRETVTKQR